MMQWHCWSMREGTRGIRAFADGSDAKGRTLVSARIEAYAFSGAKHAGVALETDNDPGGLQVFLGIPHVFNVWLTAGCPHLSSVVYRRWKKSLPDIDIMEVRFHDRAVWWSVCHDKWSWTKGTPKWRRGSFHWWDWLTGKPVYKSEVVEGPKLVTIPMPEGGYLATATLSRDTWKRPRWPWPLERRGYDINVIARPTENGPVVPDGAGSGQPRTNGYVPVPGKGENSWDCGGDGIFSMSGGARTIEEAIGQFVSSALRDRQRHAGNHNYAEPIS